MSHNHSPEKRRLSPLPLSDNQTKSDRNILSTWSSHAQDGIWKGALSRQNTSDPLREPSIYFSGVQACAHTLHLSACLPLHKYQIRKWYHLWFMTQIHPHLSVLWLCCKQIFFRIILTDGDPANLSSNPSFPSSFFFFYKPLSPPVCRFSPTSLSLCQSC